MTIAVSRSEGHALTLARVALGITPVNDALRLLTSITPAPEKLGPTARAALEDTLARGTVHALAQDGGWLSEGGKRLWERVDAPPMIFTANIVRLLRWLLSSPLSEAEVPALAFGAPLTVAEDFFVASLIDRLRGTGCDVMLSRQRALRGLPLTTLTHVAAMVSDEPLDEAPAFDIAALAPWLEGMRTLLTRNWLAVEQIRGEIFPPAHLIRIGRAQDEVIGAFLKAVDAAGRRDLATFFIDTTAQWLTPRRTAAEQTRGMDIEAPLRERTEARRRSAALYRGVAVLREWDQQHRAVRFIDDGYELAQRLVNDWSRLGERGFARAAEMVSELDAIPTLKPVEEPPAPPMA